MGQIDYGILKELVEKWDKISAGKIGTIVEEAIHDKRLLKNDGKIREPFRTILLLKILGCRPTRLLLALEYIKQHQENSLPEICRFLGRSFDTGTPRMETKNLLSCLQKLGVLKAEDVKPKGKLTKRFNIEKLQLHLFNENIHDILCGKEFDWSQLDLTALIDKGFNSKYKVRNFDGVEKTFRPLNMFEAIIRYGAPASISWKVVSIVRNGITKGKYKNIQTINKVIAEELQKVSLNTVEAFLRDNPLGLKLKGGTHDGKYLTYDIMEKILQEQLSQYKIKCLPSKPYREIILVALSEAMKDLKTKRELAVSEIPEKLQFAIFQVYGKSIVEVLSNPLVYFKKSSWFLRSAKGELTSNDPHQVAKQLLCSLSCCLAPLYLSVGLLPEKDDTSTVSLAMNLLLPSPKEPKLKPGRTEKEIRSEFKEALQESNVDVDAMVKHIDFLISLVQEEISGITIRDPSVIGTNLEKSCGFVERTIASVQGQLKT